jgi:hypothetical protein
MAVPTVEAFILTDQSFPPILLTTGDLSCLKIICREGASIMYLANEFLNAARGKEINTQSILLIHSLSQMARAATGYAEDLLVAT